MGWGGVPTGAGLVDGGGRPRALVAGDGWGRVGAWLAVPKRSKSRRRLTVKEEKWLFLKDALWGGGGGYPPELAWWTGG